ncbi:MAG: hypothetical protein ACPGRE_00715 [Flavobacteriaceae bacterium]
MKKTMSIIALVCIVFTSSMQGQQHRTAKQGRDLNPEQKAEMMALKMTLALDLSDSQTKEVEEIFLDSSKELHKLKEQKKNAEQLSQEDRYALRVSFMEQKIQVQRSLKKVLNEDQYEQWKKHQLKREKGQQKRQMKHKKMMPR